MSLATLAIDAYQLTTLAAHARAGRADQRVEMAFFFRKLPRDRRYVVFAGLERLLEHAAGMRLDEEELKLAAEVWGAPEVAAPEALEALRRLDGFEGEIDALPEGTLAFAGPGRRTDGRALEIDGVPVKLYTPLLQVRTDLVRAKLIETPWLARVNHLSMVASKAARVVTAARGKPVFEFGQRRTHSEAAMDVAYAAYLAGCVATSNVAARRRYGLPTAGTMDHFFVQAAERPGVSPAESEREAFGLFYRLYGDRSILLVDTYDTERGLRSAVAATDGRLAGVRIDSQVTTEMVRRARQILDQAGAPQAKIYVSDGLDEHRVAELAGLADGFGVGENISCSPDAAAGVGAVAKLTVNGHGKITMKLARGSGKATLPGRLEVHRYRDHDLVSLDGEHVPSGGEALLRPVWRGREALPRPSLTASREHVARQLAGLPPSLRAIERDPLREGPAQAAVAGGAPVSAAWPLVASDGLVALILELAREAGG